MSRLEKVATPPRPGPPSSRPSSPSRPGPPKPQTPSRTAESLTTKRAEAATTTLDLMSAGLTLWSMMSGARAKQVYDKATDPRIKAKAEKAYNKAQVMQLDAAALSIHSEGTGLAVAEAAGQNQFVGALVDRLELVNGVGSVAISVLPLVYQLMANHAPAEARDNMPPELMQMGVLPPKMLMEKLEAQNAAKRARLQAAILREQKTAEDELRKLQEEVASNNGHAGN